MLQIPARLAGAFQRAFATNSNANAFPAPAVLTSRPSGDGYIDVLPATCYDREVGNGMLPSLQLIFVGTSANDQTGEVNLIGYSEAPGGQWLPVPIARLDLTLGSMVTGNTNEFFVDTIASSSGPGFDINISSQTTDFANYIAFVQLSSYGFPVIGVQFDRGTGATFNALWRVV